MESKIKELVAVIFETKIDNINEESSPDTIENWDSLGHMNLVIALEEEFDLNFDDDQIVGMLKLKDIIAIVKTALRQE